MLDDPLVLEFTAARPEEVAVLLANRELGQLAPFVADLPAASAAALAARLPSWKLTGLLGVLDAALVGRLLVAAQADDAVALVSHRHESRYPGVLQTVPESERGPIYQLLEFPGHTLAALVSPDFIRVGADTLCRDFCEQLSNASDTRPRPVLVVDAQGRYQGMLRLRAAYARLNRARTVGQVADTLEPLSGLTDAATALRSRQWAEFAEMPVVDSRHRILGVVNRGMLERVAGESRPGEFSLEKVVTELAGGYLSTCGRVLESLLGRP